MANSGGALVEFVPWADATPPANPKKNNKQSHDRPAVRNRFTTTRWRAMNAGASSVAVVAIVSFAVILNFHVPQDKNAPLTVLIRVPLALTTDFRRRYFLKVRR